MNFSFEPDIFFDKQLPYKISRLHSTFLQYFEMRYGTKSVRILGSVTFILQQVLYMTVALYAPVIAVASVTPFDEWAAILVAGGICTIYTAIVSSYFSLNFIALIILLLLKLVFRVIMFDVRFQGRPERGSVDGRTASSLHACRSLIDRHLRNNGSWRTGESVGYRLSISTWSDIQVSWFSWFPISTLLSTRLPCDGDLGLMRKRGKGADSSKKIQKKANAFCDRDKDKKEHGESDSSLASIA